MYTDMQQLFLLIQIPPTVDKYYDNDKYVSKINNNLYMFPNFNNIFCSIQFPTVLFSDGPILQFWWRLIPQANLRTVYWCQQYCG